MATTIVTRFTGTCADCGSEIPAGASARYYGRGKLYGLTCHAQQPNRKERRAQNKATATRIVKAHTETPTAGPANRCLTCGKDFMSGAQLAHHLANAERLCKPKTAEDNHPGDRVICADCRKLFPNLAELDRHLCPSDTQEPAQTAPDTPQDTPVAPSASGLAAFFDEWVLKCLVYRQQTPSLDISLPLPTGIKTRKDRSGWRVIQWGKLGAPSVLQLRKCIADAQVRSGDVAQITVATGPRSEMNVHPALADFYLAEIEKVRNMKLGVPIAQHPRPITYARAYKIAA